MVHDTTNPENYRVEITPYQVAICGWFVGREFNHVTNTWENKRTVATPYNPICEFSTNNAEDRICRMMMRHIKGAKLVKRWKRDNLIDDPYGRMHKIGDITCEEWDLTECFK